MGRQRKHLSKTAVEAKKTLKGSLSQAMDFRASLGVERDENP